MGEGPAEKGAAGGPADAGSAPFGWSVLDIGTLARSAALPRFREIARASSFAPPAPADASGMGDGSGQGPAPVLPDDPLDDVPLPEALPERLLPADVMVPPSNRMQDSAPEAPMPAAAVQWLDETGSEAREVQEATPSAPVDADTDKEISANETERVLGERLIAIERSLARIADALERQVREAETDRPARLRDLGILPRVPVDVTSQMAVSWSSHAPASAAPVGTARHVPANDAEATAAPPPPADDILPSHVPEEPFPVPDMPVSNQIAAAEPEPRTQEVLEPDATGSRDEAPIHQRRMQPPEPSNVGSRLVRAVGVLLLAVLAVGLLYVLAGGDVAKLGGSLSEGLSTAGAFLATLGDRLRGIVAR